MRTRVRLRGAGHAMGSETVRNTDVATGLGLAPNWLVDRTGIEERRVCGDGEDGITLAMAAVERALADGGLSTQELGTETVLIHIQNGFVGFAPPAGVMLAGRLGLHNVRVIGLDGMCAEPISALEMGVLMLRSRRARRVVLSTSADFIRSIDKSDPSTAGLFGAGAGVLVLEAEDENLPASTLHSLHWETHSEHWQLGQLPILDHEQHEDHTDLRLGYYTMDGQQLARVAMRIVPQVLKPVLDEAGWTATEVDLVIGHQPGVKMLQMGVRALGFLAGRVPMPVRRIGNMGPASLLVNLSLARADGRLTTGTKLLLVAFGLGFSCGAAAVEI